MHTKEKNISEDIEFKKTKTSFAHIFLLALCFVLILATLLLLLAACWYTRHYGETGFDSVLFTIFANLGGVSTGLLTSFLHECVLPALVCSIVLALAVFGFRFNKCLFSKFKFSYRVLLSVIISVVFLLCAGTRVNIYGYVHKLVHQTTLYEDEFVDVTDDILAFPEDKRNLIYIFLESMETTYMSQSEGGALKENLIPELTELAEKNINFSSTNGIGGFLTPTGTGWTVAAMVAQTSGVPLKGSAGVLENNKYGQETFMPGLVSLSDILNKNGYVQALAVGSDSSFANRDVYYTQHMTDHIYDIHTAKKDGFVEDDYYVWWGMEDALLYEYAKEKLSVLANGSKPFALTILTADTHFPDGYVCDRCKNGFSEQYSNVISCASHQVAEFLSWLKEQDYYDNTTIVICGDHLSMDYQYISRNVPDDYCRQVYNCFINSVTEPHNTKNRTFTGLDIFPTTLAAMGCYIKGDRLGLGTNLFSDKRTLAEELGYERFDHELLYSSKFYIKNFMIK